MDEKEMIKKIKEEDDFIVSKKHGNSLTKMLEKMPDKGVEDSVIAKVLLIPEDMVEEIYQESVEQMRKELVNK